MPKTAINLGSGSVTVGWSKDAPVAQIGVRRFNDQQVDDSLFTDFTERSQINALIATLRKVRDQAFGRDE